MPVVFHPLIGNQIDGELLQAFGDDSLECLKILVLEKDVVPGIASVKRVVNSTSFIDPWGAAHLEFSVFSAVRVQNTLTGKRLDAQILKTVPDTFSSSYTGSKPNLLHTPNRQDRGYSVSFLKHENGLNFV